MQASIDELAPCLLDYFSSEKISLLMLIRGLDNSNHLIEKINIWQTRALIKSLAEERAALIQRVSDKELSEERESKIWIFNKGAFDTGTLNDSVFNHNA